MNKFYFVHIEKAAGSTLREIFRNNDLYFYAETPYEFSKNINNQKYYLQDEELCKINKYIPTYRGFGGHSVRIYANYGECSKDVYYGVTFLRDPVKRYLSHYYYQKYVMHLDWTLESFLSHKNFNNFMCYKICGEESAEKAIELIEKKRVFVGITENFDESLLQLKSYFKINNVFKNFDIRYKKQNENKTRKENNIKPEHLKIIQDNNREDIKLYKYFYEKQRSVIEHDSFTNELLIFQKENENFQFNFFRMNLMKLFKLLYQKPVEKMIRDTSSLGLGG